MPFIIFFRGDPGVGKSILACQLGKSLKVTVLDYDDIKGPLVNRLSPDILPRLSYDIAENILMSNIKMGLDIVFDSHGYYREFFDKCVSIAGYENVIIINCICSDHSCPVKNPTTMPVLTVL